jgi:hypothetical protein
MLKLRASAILDSARLRMKVILRTVGEAVGWVFGFYIISWLNPSRIERRDILDHGILHCVFVRIPV